MWVLEGCWRLSESQSCALSGAICLQIREEIDQYGIRIYQFPECDSDEDEEFKLQDQALKVGLAPLVPSLEEQSPMARRTCPPGVLLGFFGAPQVLRQLQHGGVGTYCTAHMHHQDPTGATCSLGWGWGGESHAAVPPGGLHGWGSGRSWQMGMIWPRRCVWRDMGHVGKDRALPTPAVLLQESIPFAVIGSNTIVEAKGRRVRGRLYPWGIVEGNVGLCPRGPFRDIIE